MPVSRRTSALLAAAALALAACTAERDDAADVPEQPGATAAPVWDTSPASVAAIGDSITRAFDACSVLADCAEVSWATGTDVSVPSLAQLLLAESEETDGGGKRATGGRSVEERSWNVAESGAVMADLPDQARRAVEYDPELVTVLIGANDACTHDLDSMTDTADFRQDFTESMDIIRTALPDTQVYVASVPDLLQLWSEARDNSLARQVWRFGICPSMLSDPLAITDEAHERRATVREQVQEYNSVLEEVCATDQRCRYDDGAVFDYPFTAKELSEWDWFHPSREGQIALARLAYEQITRK